MKRYRIVTLSVTIFVIVMCFMFNPNLVLLPGCFLVLVLLQTILALLQFCDVIYRWKEYKKAEKEEFCEHISGMVIWDEKIPHMPFVMTLRVRIVQFGIHPDRAGPAFVVS